MVNTWSSVACEAESRTARPFAVFTIELPSPMFPVSLPITDTDVQMVIAARRIRRARDDAHWLSSCLLSNAFSHGITKVLPTVLPLVYFGLDPLQPSMWVDAFLCVILVLESVILPSNIVFGSAVRFDARLFALRRILWSPWLARSRQALRRISHR